MTVKTEDVELLRTLPADYRLRLYDDEANLRQVERAFRQSAADGKPGRTRTNELKNVLWRDLSASVLKTKSSISV